jgi:dihydrofolate reductase
MGDVLASFSMSLDGFIALPDDSVGPLFEWYDNGDVEVRWPGMDMVSHVTPQSAGYLHGVIEGTGALVVGRRIFDYTHGWGGDHPLHVPVFVVTHRPADDWQREHPDAPFTFVTDGVESAVAQAQEVAGDKIVGVAGPNVVGQCLAAGLIDEVRVDLVPVLLGEGIRYFDELGDAPRMFDNPTVVEGDRVTHLIYRVRRP